LLGDLLSLEAFFVVLGLGDRVINTVKTQRATGPAKIKKLPFAMAMTNRNIPMAIIRQKIRSNCFLNFIAKPKK